MNKPNTLSRTLILGWSLTVLTVTAAAAAEPAPDNVQTLISQNCVQCHGSEVYTRPDRKVTSLDGLGRQVRRCETTLQLRWFDEDVQGVTNYLNQSYYRFQP
jgi:cytochrome c553